MRGYLAELHSKSVYLQAIAEALETLLEKKVDHDVSTELAAAMIGLIAEIQHGLDTNNLPEDA